MTDLTFYVDRYRHLVCVPYSVDNLHEMARQLDIARCWLCRLGKATQQITCHHSQDCFKQERHASMKVMPVITKNVTHTAPGSSCPADTAVMTMNAPVAMNSMNARERRSDSGEDSTSLGGRGGGRICRASIKKPSNWEALVGQSVCPEWIQSSF